MVPGFPARFSILVTPAIITSLATLGECRFRINLCLICMLVRRRSLFLDQWAGAAGSFLELWQWKSSG
jgi:hypothetical protein